MAKARRVAAVAVVLLIVGLVVHSSITATGEPCAVQPSSDNTGIALGSGYTAMSDAEMDRTVEAIRSSGSHWVRFDIDWSAIESTEGTFDWSGTDRLVGHREIFRARDSRSHHLHACLGKRSGSDES